MEKQMIQALIHTLDGLEVRGKDNLGRLLGCITLLESMLQEEKEEEDDGR